MRGCACGDGTQPFGDASSPWRMLPRRRIGQPFIVASFQANPNSAQVDGTTALHWAAYHDRTETAQALLASGAKAAAANRYGVTPLSLACTNGNETLVAALLDAGADANTELTVARPRS